MKTNQSHARHGQISPLKHSSYSPCLMHQYLSDWANSGRPNIPMRDWGLTSWPARCGSNFSSAEDRTSRRLYARGGYVYTTPRDRTASLLCGAIRGDTSRLGTSVDRFAFYLTLIRTRSFGRGRKGRPSSRPTYAGWNCHWVTRDDILKCF